MRVVAILDLCVLSLLCGKGNCIEIVLFTNSLASGDCVDWLRGRANTDANR